MQTEAYDQYRGEAGGWLKRARADLLAALVRDYAPSTSGLALLEVGAGVGQNLHGLAELGVVDAVEIDPEAAAAIRERSVARDVFEQPIPFELDRDYDVVCALDVIEHIEDDDAAIRWLADHLRPGGICVLTVPAYGWLFSDHDVALGHYRRYTARQLRERVSKHLEVETVGYFNSLLFPAAVASRAAWQIGRRIERGGAGQKQPAPKGKRIDALLSLVLDTEVRGAARGLRAPFGLSVYLVARRPA